MRGYVKPLKPVIIKIVIVAVLITFIVWLLLDSRSGERYWTASSRCEVKAAVRVDGGNIDIVDADSSRRFARRPDKFSVDRFLGYDRDQKCLVLYGSRDGELNTSVVALYKDKGMRSIDLQSVEVNEALDEYNFDVPDLRNRVCFQDGSIIVPGERKGVPLARFFNLSGDLEHEVVFTLPPDLRGCSLKSVLRIRDGNYVISVGSDEGQTILLCDREGKAFETVGQGYDLCYDPTHHRVVFMEDVEDCNIVVLDLSSKTRRIIKIGRPPYSLPLDDFEKLADIKLSPDGKWVLASYHCDSFIRGYDQSLYAYSLDPRNRRWCRVQEYVEPDLWLPVDE